MKNIAEIRAEATAGLKISDAEALTVVEQKLLAIATVRHGPNVVDRIEARATPCAFVLYAHIRSGVGITEADMAGVRTCVCVDGIECRVPENTGKLCVVTTIARPVRLFAEPRPRKRVRYDVYDDDDDDHAPDTAEVVSTQLRVGEAAWEEVPPQTKTAAVAAKSGLGTLLSFSWLRSGSAAATTKRKAGPACSRARAPPSDGSGSCSD
jgi:hypothetical protein